MGVLVLIVGGVLLLKHSQQLSPALPTNATTTQAVNPTTLSIYTSGEYGFSFFYPSDAKVVDAYSSTTLAGIPWRIGATGSGTPMVRILNDNEEVRVGKSTDQRELKVCTQAGPAETLAAPVTVGSTTWQQTTFQKLGTDNEQRVTSYRTLHDRTCYAVELLEPLQGNASSTGYTLNDTITSFNFAQP